MDIKADMLTKEDFLKHLHEGLNHIYDPDHLRRNPLASLFGVANRFDIVSALQRILLEAIGSLEPKPNMPPQSPAWQVYESLHYRYVEKLSQEDIANQLGFGTRHLRRKQHDALEMLADVLWDKYGLDNSNLSATGGKSATEHDQLGTPGVSDELEWLKYASQVTPTDLSQTLPPVLDLAQKLSDRHKVQLEIETINGPIHLAVLAVALRQMLLSLFSVVIPRASGGHLRVSVQQFRWEVEIRILCKNYPSGSKPALNDEANNLNLAHQLADLCGCKLILQVDANRFDARMLLPTLEQLPVLAIDDNADALQLMQRFASGTRYHFKGTRDPEEVFNLIEKFAPRIILLDVMMPLIDGWEMLGRLRQHPLTQQIPIVICTILSQEEMALMMGASGFVRKPITQKTFLESLDRQAQQMEPALD